MSLVYYTKEYRATGYTFFKWPPRFIFDPPAGHLGSMAFKGLAECQFSAISL